MGDHRGRHGRIVGTVTALALITAGCADTPATAPTTPATPSTAAAVATPGAATGSATEAAAPTSDPTAAAGPPRCTAGELSASLTAGEGAAGTVHRTLLLTNVGRQTCELRGFPGVSYVAGEDGHQVGPSAETVGERGAQVRLDPGDAAAADVGLVQVANFDPAVCQPTPVRGLRVYPPGDTAALFVPAEGTGCAGTPPGPQLTVATLVAS